MPEHTDISQQIKKYLNGELDTHAMHELERRAQDDPFLMDALEGYEKVAAGHDAGLNELQSRLKQRIVKKEARIIPWRTIGIAASILLLFGIGLFWYTERLSPPLMKRMIVQQPTVNAPQPAQKQAPIDSVPAGMVANTDKEIAKKEKRVAVNRKNIEYAPLTVAADANASTPPEESELRTSDDNAVFKSKDTTPLNEMIVMDYTAKKKANTLQTEAQIGSTADSASRLADKETAGIMKIDTNKLKGNIVPIKGTNLASANIDKNGYNAASNQYRNIQQQYASSYQQKQGLNEMAAQPNFGASLNNLTKGISAKRSWSAGNMSPFNPMKLHGEMVRGMVKASGEPVTYATVKIKGTNISTLTDADGRFTLYTVPDKAILQVTADGDVLKETKVTRRDMQIISIQTPGNDNNNTLEDLQPRPSTGWSDFYGYLHQSAVSPDGKKGAVKLSFKVNADNSLSDFRIIKGVSTQTNNLAIKLVKDGPEWYSPSDDKAQMVTISIKFRTRYK
ncbi:MAG: carboxypeptidase-like regulatory domain-containing protein [Mucilaginibacter sp.]